MVKVYFVVKCCLQFGDKMVGCYGNKGVVLKIVLIEDMLYMVDGCLVDVVLNLFGVLLWMNVGQVLEVYFGWVVKGFGWCIGEMLQCQVKIEELCMFLMKIYNELGCQEDLESFIDDEIFEFVKNLCEGVLFVMLVFDGVIEEEMGKMFDFVFLDDIVEQFGMNLLKNQVCLYDGCMGEMFECCVMFGYMYYLKLYYLVDDKMYVCLIGLYLFVMQQLLGGKVQFGGQCFGEMEVWVFEVYGVFYVLQEMLMVKLDDVIGWMKVYENFVKGDYVIDVGMLEFFNVFVKEICLFGIDIDFDCN